jgi:hypothetical protein
MEDKMGYYTDFTITAISPNSTRAEKARMELQEMSGYLGWDEEGTITDVKWYDWEKNLKSISKAFPEVFFRLDGTGEETEDIWAAFAHMGKVEIVRAKIVIEEPAWVADVPEVLKVAAEKQEKIDRTNRIAALKMERAKLDKELANLMEKS